MGTRFGNVIVIPSDEQFPSSYFDLILGMTQQFPNGIDAAMAKHILCQQINTGTSKLESKYAFGFGQISLHKKSSDFKGHLAEQLHTYGYPFMVIRCEFLLSSRSAEGLIGRLPE